MVLDILLGAGVPRLVSGLGTSFLLLCLFGFEVLRGFRACSVGVLHFLRFPLLPCLTLRTSMSPGVITHPKGITIHACIHAQRHTCI